MTKINLRLAKLIVYPWTFNTEMKEQLKADLATMTREELDGVFKQTTNRGAQDIIIEFLANTMQRAC